MSEIPSNGWVTDAEIVRWKDADTVVVRVNREFAIRMQEGIDIRYDAPESSTLEGQQATEYARKEWPSGTIVKVFIPTNKPVELMDFNSFNRIVGVIWDSFKRNVVSVLKGAGYEKKNFPDGGTPVSHSK